jgi:hypothetical protein
MADGKNTIVIYKDWKNIFEKLTDEESGRLIKHLFRFVNDENPESDRLIELVFEPIKLTLKRDLKHWETVIEKRREAGKKGGIASGETRKQNEANEANALIVKQKQANEADSVIDIDSVIVIEKEKKIDRIVFIEKIQKDFYQSLTPFVKEFGRDTLREFYEYWSEPNKSKTKIKFQLEKTWDTRLRLLRWVKNDFGKKKIEQATTKSSDLTKLYKKID